VVPRRCTAPIAGRAGVDGHRPGHAGCHEYPCGRDMCRDPRPHCQEVGKSAGLTGQGLAEATRQHFTRVSRIENGVQPPTERNIHDWCAACGAEDQITEPTATARSVDSAYLESRRWTRTGCRRRPADPGMGAAPPAFAGPSQSNHRDLALGALGRQTRPLPAGTATQSAAISPAMESQTQMTGLGELKPAPHPRHDPLRLPTRPRFQMAEKFCHPQIGLDTGPVQLARGVSVAAPSTSASRASSARMRRSRVCSDGMLRHSTGWQTAWCGFPSRPYAVLRATRSGTNCSSAVSEPW
jgi:hypothetical protein